MRKIKTPVQSYENFCKAFAGVFIKHAKNKGTYHTCYIRGAIEEYCYADPDRRHFLMEDACAEDACGYRIARALLVQGWHDATIVEHSLTQQEYVDAAEDYGFLECLERAGYVSAGSFSRHSNGLRYAWLLDGAPDLEEFFEVDEDDED